jgi:3-oxoacyl-[acyl-carrier protein] reductase
MRLQGKAAIVTGAASGIGKATAELFAKEGAKVLTVDLPGKGTALEVDIAAEGAPKKIVETAISKFGRLDIVMNCAGVASNKLAEEFTREAWDRTLAVNLTAPFLISQAAIPHLRESGAGRIINVASVMADGTDYGLSAYCASKAGVAGFTRTLALELGKFKITANYLLPGAIRTGMTSPLWDARPEVAEIWAKKSALRRLGRPEDLAKAALFLASDDGAFVTGHGLTVDGGLMLRV